jgi:hypothetical protein
LNIRGGYILKIHIIALNICMCKCIRFTGLRVRRFRCFFARFLVQQVCGFGHKKRAAEGSFSAALVVQYCAVTMLCGFWV